MPYTRSDIQKLVAHPVAHITDTYVAIETQYIFTLFYEQYEMFNSQKKKKNARKVCFFHCRRNLLIRQCFILYALVA